MDRFEWSKRSKEVCLKLNVISLLKDFWVYPSDHVTGEDLENIRTLRDALTTSGPIKAELDRDLKVLLPTQASQSFSLPPDFFSLSAEEIRKEQQMK